MYTYRTNIIADLAAQLRRSPRRHCLKHLHNIEFLLSVVVSAERYPLDFIWHALTGVRRRKVTTEINGPILLHGHELRDDLVTLADDLSNCARLPASACRQSLYTITELADRLGVSKKTVARWRKRGLLAWKVLGTDGRSRTMIPEHCLRRFVADNAGLVTRASSYSRLTAEEQERIAARARKLAEQVGSTINSATRVIAVETGRACETIRILLKQLQEEHPAEALWSPPEPLVDIPDNRLRIWEAYQDGTSLEVLAERFDRPVTEIYDIVTEMRANTLKARSIEYIHGAEFDHPNAYAEIMDDPAAQAPYAEPKKSPRIPANLAPYLRELFHIPLLSPAGEYALCRQFNFLKYRAETLRRQIVPGQTTARELDRIETLLDKAAQLKNQISKSNLRLVVHVAKRHIRPDYDLYEAVSDGNVTLLRAVDLFDFTRGFKFSTYASWSIIRRMARQEWDRRRHQARYQTGNDELLREVRAAEDEDDTSAPLRDLIERMSDTLSRRERFILHHRFGLGGEGFQTLVQVGQRIGISRERVRQIESRALGRLRAEFSAEAEKL
ncbi:MAG: sigma-70 family RNA polymerase sigma factor [Planctomycetota bacterium]